MEERSTSFDYSARYHKIGEISRHTKEIWFVLHGYGQLSKYFIKHFQILHEKNAVVIAPEGLSRFYINGFGGRIGATWMTKEDRIRDINNYLNYLNSIYQAEIPLKNDLKINLLGFSQGSATVSRWALCDEVQFDKLILWAGIFPPDMDFDKGKEKLKEKKIYYVYGSKDPFLNDARFEEQAKLSAELEVSPQTIVFDGEHTIHQETLVRLIDDK